MVQRCQHLLTGLQKVCHNAVEEVAMQQAVLAQALQFPKPYQ
jgi:hypothetical protein